MYRINQPPTNVPQNHQPIHGVINQMTGMSGIDENMLASVKSEPMHEAASTSATNGHVVFANKPTRMDR